MRNNQDNDIAEDEDEAFDLDIRDDDLEDELFLDAEEGRIVPRKLEEAFKERGYSLRMVRITLKGEPDLGSVFKRKQQGYEFVTPDEVQDYMGSAFLGRNLHGINTVGVEHDLVTKGDLALMKISLKRQQRLRQRNAERTAAQSQQADAASSQYVKFHNDSRTQVQYGQLPKKSTTFKD